MKFVIGFEYMYIEKLIYKDSVLELRSYAVVLVWMIYRERAGKKVVNRIKMKAILWNLMF